MMMLRGTTPFYRFSFTPNMRMLSTAKIPMLGGKPVCWINTQYLINTAQIKISLPEKGETVFFVSPETSVQDFKQKCQDEDSCISKVEILRGNSTEPVADEETVSLYDLLKVRDIPLYLKLNNILYQFQTQRMNQSQKQLQINEISNWYSYCQDLGMN